MVKKDPKKKKQTVVIEDNLNPLFYQTIEMSYEVRDINDPYSYPPFILDVWDEDQDLFDSTDDFLGRAIIEPEDLGEALVIQGKNFGNSSAGGESHKNEIPVRPKWHPIHF